MPRRSQQRRRQTWPGSELRRRQSHRRPAASQKCRLCPRRPALRAPLHVTQRCSPMPAQLQGTTRPGQPSLGRRLASLMSQRRELCSGPQMGRYWSVGIRSSRSGRCLVESANMGSQFAPAQRGNSMRRRNCVRMICRSTGPTSSTSLRANTSTIKGTSAATSRQQHRRSQNTDMCISTRLPQTTHSALRGQSAASKPSTGHARRVC